MRTATTLMILLVTGLGWSLDLEEAVQTALANRGDVEAALYDVESATWEERNARFWFLPSVSANLTFLRYYDLQQIEVPGMGSFQMGYEWISQAGIVAEVPLYVPQGPWGFRVASRATDMSRTQLDASSQDAMLDVIGAFYGVLLARDLVLVSDEALEIAREGYELASLKYEAGAISRFELLQSEVAWENRKPEAIAAESRLENALAGLSVAMGGNADEVPEVEGCLENCLPLEIPGSLEECRAVMRANSPELARASSMRDMAGARVGLARSSFFPSVFLQANYGFTAQREDWHFEIDDYERDLNVMLALQVPIFSGLGDISSYNSARAERRSAEAGADALEQGSHLSLVQAWNGLEESRERAEATAYTRAQAEEAAGIATVSYEAGTITRLEMDQAFLALTSARTNYASALYSLRLSEAGLARAMGTLDRLVFPRLHRASIHEGEEPLTDHQQTDQETSND